MLEAVTANSTIDDPRRANIVESGGSRDLRANDWLSIACRFVERARSVLYGRCDRAVRRGNRRKLLEYNADTPTSLARLARPWNWQREFRSADQFTRCTKN